MSGTHRMISNESTLRHMRTTMIACTFATIAACGLSACKNPDRTTRYQPSSTTAMQAATPAPAPKAKVRTKASYDATMSKSSPD